MNIYTFTYKQGREALEKRVPALNVLFAFNAFCTEVRGYVTSHTVQFCGVQAGIKTWEVPEFNPDGSNVKITGSGTKKSTGRKQ
jgi:hypothetical protein